MSDSAMRSSRKPGFEGVRIQGGADGGSACRCWGLKA